MPACGVSVYSRLGCMTVCMTYVHMYVYAHIWSVVIRTPDTYNFKLFLPSIIAQSPLCLLAFRLFSVMW